MANSKVSDLNTIESISDTDVMLIENDTGTYKITISKLAESIGGSGTSQDIHTIFGITDAIDTYENNGDEYVTDITFTN